MLRLGILSKVLKSQHINFVLASQNRQLSDIISELLEPISKCVENTVSPLRVFAVVEEAIKLIEHEDVPAIFLLDPELKAEFLPLAESRPLCKREVVCFLLGHRGEDKLAEDKLAGCFAKTVATPLYPLSLEHHQSAQALLTIATQLLATSLELVQERQNFQLIMSNLAEGILITNSDGLIQFTNRRMEEITGYTAEEMLNTHIHQILLGTDVSPDKEQKIAQMQRRYAARLQGYSEHYEFEISRKDGRKRWLEINAAPYRDPSGKILGGIGVNTDITERKRLEEQLLWSQKMEAVGRLAGGVAHDFNNLLTAIHGYADLLLRRLPHGEQYRREVEGIYRASQAASALTQQLLAIGRRQVAQPQAINLNQIVEDVRDILRGSIGEHIELVVSIGENIPHIKVDPVQIQQVLLNLVLNARDAMPNGGQLTISTSSIEVTSHVGNELTQQGLAPGNYVVLSVVDTGIGMDETTKKHLFEPFYTTKQGQNMGLGLSTVYGIITAQRGVILVTSEPGVGSRFDVYLPATNEKPFKVLAENATEAATGRELILLVEDEDIVRELVLDILHSCGYRVLTASGAKEAMKILDKTEMPVDLLLTDVVMPDIDGLQLANKLKEANSKIRVLLMSGCPGDSELAQQVRDSGWPFIAKPFNLQELSARVRQALSSFA